MQAKARLRMALSVCDASFMAPFLDMVAAMLPFDVEADEAAAAAQLDGNRRRASQQPASGSAARPSLQQDLTQITQRLADPQAAAPSGAEGAGRSASADLAAVLFRAALQVRRHPHTPRPACRRCSARLQTVCLQVTPASVRAWYADLRDKELAAAVHAYTTANEAPALMRGEVSSVEALAARDATLDIKASSGASELVAAVDVDEGAMIELSIHMPPSFPLLPAEVRVFDAHATASSLLAVVAERCTSPSRRRRLRAFEREA